MRNRIKRMGLVMVAMVGLAALPAAGADKAPAGAEQALASRFADMAQRSLMKQALEDADFRRCVALLEAARRCDPAEPRYPRLQADALVRLRDADRAVEAINAYRKLKPEDRGSQLELIGLYTDRMQNNIEQKIAYYRDILARESVAREVRAVVAMRLAGELKENKREGEASAQVDAALKLDPLNWDALLWRWSEQQGKATAAQRVSLLVGLIRSNPAGLAGRDRNAPLAAMLLAREVSDQGLVNEGLQWFNIAINLESRIRTVSTEQVVEAASQLYIADKVDIATALLDRVLTISPNDYGALLLRMQVEARSKEKQTETYRAPARTALVNAVETARGKLGIRGAATRPANDVSRALPDLGADGGAAGSADEALRAAYRQAVGDLAWFEAFFEARPEEAEKLIAAYLTAGKAPAQEEFAARVLGWAFLQRGKVEEARVKLSAVAAKDPMASLGVVSLEKDPAVIKSEGEKLLAREPNGLMGALIYDALKDKGVKVKPGPDSAGVLAALSALPPNWMAIVEAPQRFYALRGEPLKVTYAYGEPMMVRVTLQNNSEFDLTVGPKGVIQNTLWFDATLGGAMGQKVPGVAIENLSEHLVLRPRQGVTLMVRLDQGTLREALMANLLPAVAITGSVKTNPQVSPNGQAEAGPSGYQASFPRIMERSGFPLNEGSIKKLAADVKSASGAEKVRLIDMAGMLTLQLRFQKGTTPDAVKAAEPLSEALKAVRGDADANVAAYASFMYAVSATEGDAGTAVQKMLLPEASWQEKTLGLWAMGRLPAERAKALAAEAARDADPVVKAVAAITLAALEGGPSTRPTTAPADRK